MKRKKVQQQRGRMTTTEINKKKRKSSRQNRCLFSFFSFEDRADKHGVILCTVSKDGFQQQ
ncbi:hypothetical protein RP20_CCG028085 [Aedes albopictus]|nr:hypothetical protein RP20_CCG028085 [Aedes albopictus]